MARKTERVDMRLTREQKELIELAASASGQTVSGFATSALLAQAHEVLAREAETVLSQADFLAFLDLVEASEPNAELKAAVRRVRERDAESQTVDPREDR